MITDVMKLFRATQNGTGKESRIVLLLAPVLKAADGDVGVWTAHVPCLGIVTHEHNAVDEGCRHLHWSSATAQKPMTNV